MNIEKIPNNVWNDLIQGKVDFSFQALPIKILLSRLRVTVKYDKKDETLNQSVQELKNLIVRNQNLMSIQNDIKTIMEGRGI